MKQQWETERYAAAHRDRISHRNPIITSDCNLRTLYQSGNSHQLSMTAQDLLHYTSTETANMDEKEKNSTTCSTPIHPTTSSVTTFILLADSSTQKSPKTVTKKLQEQWAPAYYTTLPTTTDRDVSALTLQLTFDTRNPGFPAQGLGSRPGPTHWALTCNLTISWSMASGLTRLGTVEPKIV